MFLSIKELYDLAIKIQSKDSSDELNVKINLPEFANKLFAIFNSNDVEELLSFIDLESGDSYSFSDSRFQNIKFELVY